MMGRLSTLRRDERGASIIEMGIAMPILCTMLIGMVDLSGAYSAKLQAEQGAQRSVEYVQRNGFKTGQEDTLKTEATTGAGTGSSASVDTWSTCNGTKAAFDDSCTSPTVTRYVRVSVTKTYTPYIKIPAAFGGGANYTVHGSASLRIQ